MATRELSGMTNEELVAKVETVARILATGHRPPNERPFSAKLVRELARRLRELEADRERLHAAHMKCIVGVEELVQDEIISAGRGREIHGMTTDEQLEYWRLRYAARKEPSDD